MQEKELELADGSLYYEIDEETGRKTIRITRFQGNGSHLEVPKRIEDLPVTRVGKKAFLSRKNLRRVVLPATVEEVGDWAFAYCDHLSEVVLPHKEIRFGKAVFMECGQLQRILAEPQTLGQSEKEFPAELLAAAVTRMDAAYLLDIEASGTEEWLKKWDARLLTLLHASDQEGYSKQVLCGEEDYGSTDLVAYMSGRRKEKVRLILLRLLFCQGLSVKLRKELEGYLLAHTKGRESEETWQVILTEHGTHREYYSLFSSIGCVVEENLNSILDDIGEDFPEMKAFFLRTCSYREGTSDSTDFFETLEL